MARILAFSCLCLLISFPARALSPEVQRALIEAANMASNQLPKRVDEATTWRSVIATPNGLIYSYWFDKGGGPISNYKEILIRNICGQEAMRRGTRLGVSYTYMYYSHDGNLVANVEITERVCQAR